MFTKRRRFYSTAAAVAHCLVVFVCVVLVFVSHHSVIDLLGYCFFWYVGLPASSPLTRFPEVCCASTQ